MDLKYGSDEAKKFVTNIGLITSNGKHGENIMAAEWTHVVSYSPWLVMINIGWSSATAENILETKVFGVNIAAEEHNSISSISGSRSGKDINKISMLKELGVEFYKANEINVPMLKGAALNLECRVVRHENIGSKTMIIGEVIHSEVRKDAVPIIFSSGSYKKVTDFVAPSQRMTQEELEALGKKHKKSLALHLLMPCYDNINSFSTFLSRRSL